MNVLVASASGRLPAQAASLAPSPRSEGRIAVVDFIKGTLVLVMVLYHWINYFYGVQWGGYRYLRFLTPSFIFISGFLISRVSLKTSYVADQSRFRRRLFGRATKLLLIFIALNVVADLTVGSRLDLRESDPSMLLTTAYGVFISGDGLAAFDILVSIAYFLLLVPLLLVVCRRLHVPLMAVAVAAIALVVAWGFVERTNPHVEMLAIGALGLAAGERTAAGFDGSRWQQVLMLALGYLLYLLAIVRWNVLFPLQVVGVCLSLLVIAEIARAWGTEGWTPREIVRLGQYSLLSYIVQIAVLQLLRVGLRGFQPTGAAVVLPLVVTVMATVASIEIADRLRRRSRAFDRVYRSLFA